MCRLICGHSQTLPHAPIQGDIREFLHNIRKRQKESIQDEERLLSELSLGLRSRIASAVNEQYLLEMPFFDGTTLLKVPFRKQG